MRELAGKNYFTKQPGCRNNWSINFKKNLVLAIIRRVVRCKFHIEVAKETLVM